MADWARPVVAYEIRGRDSARLREFYATLFNWKLDTERIPGIAFVEPGVGGPDVGGTIVPSDAAGVSLYVQVLDLRASMQRAEDLGGKVLAQPVDVPNGPTISRIADPEGNQIGLVQQ